MIKLIAMLKRKSELTAEEFHRHWREVHGPLIRNTKSGSYVVRYEQNHRPLSDYGHPMVSDYDGVTVQWYRSMEEFRASIAEPDFAMIQADFEKFIDTASLVWLLTEEEEVVIDG